MSSQVFVFPDNKYKDENRSGWYIYRNSDRNEATLRVQDSNMKIKGAVRLNTSLSPPTFQGYNGTEWVNFNAQKGDPGEQGNGFNSVIELENLHGGEGEIFRRQLIDTRNDVDKIQLRTLSAGITSINGAPLETMYIKTEDHTINLTALPQPFEWNIANQPIPNMKSNPITDRQFKCYGDVSIWRSDCHISQGQVVVISGNKDGYITVSPLVYSAINKFRKAQTPLGIALRSVIPDQPLPVCTKGITTAKVSSKVPNNIIADNSIEFAGQPALVGEDGFIFASKVKPSVDYIQVGVFVEEGGNTDWQLVNI